MLLKPGKYVQYINLPVICISVVCYLNRIAKNLSGFLCLLQGFSKWQWGLWEHSYTLVAGEEGGFLSSLCSGSGAVSWDTINPCYKVAALDWPRTCTLILWATLILDRYLKSLSCIFLTSGLYWWKYSSLRHVWSLGHLSAVYRLEGPRLLPEELLS